MLNWQVPLAVELLGTLDEYTYQGEIKELV